MIRRQDVVDVAVALLRDGGPDALTTVAVAQRLGVSQSAIYRHVANVDELTTLATAVVIAGLNQAVRRALLAGEDEWGHEGAIMSFSERLMATLTAERRSFEIIDRWRFADGELGAGIRRSLTRSRDLVAATLEAAWREEYGYTGELGSAERTIQRAHAQLLQDEVAGFARLVNSRRPLAREAVVQVFELRAYAGYLAYVADMHLHLGLPRPEIDSVRFSLTSRTPPAARPQ
jgi:AcrR family transcriptional regulator